MKNYSYKGTIIAVIAILIMVILYKFILKPEENGKDTTETTERPTFAYEAVPAELHAMPTE